VGYDRAVDRPRIELRRAQPEDALVIARIWQAGWPDGHLGNVPDELAAIRDEADFRERATKLVPLAAVAEVDGATVGFVAVTGDEVTQVYVTAEHRGRGIADALLDHAEKAIRGAGHGSAWLAVVDGNARARRFYERRGWSDGGPLLYAAEARGTTMEVAVRRYVKAL
jgi:GNAT superfamily N-acetyltransferase